jgi:hypothetical protein
VSRFLAINIEGKIGQLTVRRTSSFISLCTHSKTYIIRRSFFEIVTVLNMCNFLDAERKSISGLEGLKYFSDIFYEDFF